jgi:copper homeostasis protein CutC
MEDSIAAYSENKLLYDIIKGFLNEQYEIDVEQFRMVTAHKDTLEIILNSASNAYTSGNEHNVIDLESVLKKRKRHKYYFNK